MLITTRNKGRWSMPNGGANGNRKPHRTAAIEAYEEAGLVGAVEKRPVGKFKHRKGRGADKQTLQVSVFPMKVRRRERWWPEDSERRSGFLSTQQGIWFKKSS
jgi:8-oxo-dGTP pyrophosphatase MutT (NUDIX family)